MKKKNIKWSNMVSVIITVAAFIFVLVLYDKISKEMKRNSQVIVSFF